MPTQQLANYAQTTLASACTSAATTLSVVSAAGFPTAGNFMVRIDDPAPATTFEYVEIASVSGTTLTTSTNGPTSNGRGMENTTGIAHGAGAFVGNDITAAMLIRAFPLGCLGEAQVSAAQGSITTQTDLTGLTVTVTVGTSRKIKVTATGSFSSTVAGDNIGFYLVESATVLDQNLNTVPTAGFQCGQAITAYLTPTAGSHTYKLQAGRVGGTGTITMTAGTGASNPIAKIIVEDVGSI